MPSFDMIFSPDGDVIVGNIQDVVGNQCMALTAPYEHSLGIVERLQVLEGCQSVESDVGQSA